VPNFTSVCSTLLCVSGKPTTDIPASISYFSALVSQRDDRNHSHKSDKGHHKC